jgi:hypothetical protein
MSMGLHVLSDQRLNNSAEWQHAMNLASYPVQLSDGFQFASINGFAPVALNGTQTGFECFHDDVSKAMDFLGRENFGYQWKYALAFRWRGTSLDELQAAWMAATAYAAATGGIVFDHEAGKVLTLREARAAVDQIIRNIPRMAEALATIRKEFET